MNKEQVFTSDISGRFNLRKPKSKTQTPLYFVIRFKGKQYKIPTNVKVNPQHWSKSKQIAIISNVYSERENMNNKIVNDKISQYLQKYKELKDYLCSQVVEDLIPFIKKSMYQNMGKTKKKDMSITKMIEDAYETYYKEIKPQTKERSIESRKYKLEHFLTFIREKHIDNDLKALMQQEYNDYKKYLLSKVEKGEIGYEYVNDSCLLIKTLVNDVLIGIKDNKFNLTPLSYQKIKDTRKLSERGGFALNYDEIEAIKNCKAKTETQENFRKAFLIQLAMGCRISDLNTLLNKDYEIVKDRNGVGIKYLTKKREISAFIPVAPIIKNYPSITETLLSEDFPKFTEKQLKNDRLLTCSMDRHLKNIAKQANLDRIIESKDSSLALQKKHIFECITSHCARHTFVTTAWRQGVDKEVIINATGHTDTQMIDEVYSHKSLEDKIEKSLEYAANHNKQSNDIQANAIDGNLLYEKGKELGRKDKENELINDAKKVLTFLGVPSSEWVDENDIKKLELLINKRDHEIYDLLPEQEKEKTKPLWLEEHLDFKTKCNMLRSRIDNASYRKIVEQEFLLPIESDDNP